VEESKEERKGEEEQQQQQQPVFFACARLGDLPRLLAHFDMEKEERGKDKSTSLPPSLPSSLPPSPDPMPAAAAGKFGHGRAGEG